VSDNSVIEIDDINVNFRAVVEEGSGDLNEHNWKVASWPDRLTDLSDGVGVRQMSQQVSMDPAAGSGAASTFIIPDEVSPAPISQLTQEFITTGGNFWLLASFVAILPWYKPSVTGDPTALKESAFGAHFAFRLDGDILLDSLVGSGDTTNDKYETNHFVNTPPGAGVLSFSSTGITATYASVVVEAIVSLPPGTHKLEVVAIPPAKSRLPPDTDPQYEKYAKTVTTREVIILELRR
jgi:hypothetical protein